MREFLQGLREGNNSLVARIAAIAAIGGLLFGFDTGVISGALLFIKKDLHASSFEQEAIVGALLLGAVGGAILSGYLADALSRRNTKIISGVVYVIGALGSAFAVNVPMLVAFRFVLGLSVGTASFVSPMYISEVAPPKLRGGLTSFNQLAITVGILLAYIVNLIFAGVPGDWRWMLGAGAVPGAALAVGMLTVPKTPRWLVEKNRDDEAREVLTLLRDGIEDADVDQELQDIRRATEESSGAKVRDVFRPRLRPLLTIGIGLAVFQQIVGVNTVIYYAPTILAQTGLTDSGAIVRTVFVGLTNVIFTVVAILVIDKVGRRALLVPGTAGLVIALGVLGAYFAFPGLQEQAPYLALVALLFYIACFAVGLGPVFWLMISEIYPIGVRSPAMSVSTVANWGFNFLVAFTFLTLVETLGRSGTFFLYAGVAVVAVWFFWARVPETKGRTLEEIQADVSGEEAASR